MAGFLHVPVQLQVEVPVIAMTVGELFRLDKGSLVNTAQLTGANVPLVVGGRLLAWGEFQVIGDRLAVRVAELA
jgi:flagellar motor switch/type III secretory pathway protein FliN